MDRPAVKVDYSEMRSRSNPPDPAARYLWASRVIERGRFCQNLKRLRRALGPIALEFRRSGFQISRAFPLLGVLDGLEDRGAFHTAPRKECVSTWWWFRTNAARWFLLKWRDYLGRKLYQKWPARAGWNDYWMSRWFVSADPEALQEIYQRAVAVPGADADADELGTLSTARWMVSSVRGQHPDFDLAISALEDHYGLRVLSLLPPTPGVGFVPLLPGICSRCGCPQDKPASCNCLCHTVTAKERDAARQ